VQLLLLVLCWWYDVVFLATLTEREQAGAQKGFGFDKHTDNRLVANKALYSESNKFTEFSESNNSDGNRK
jgi:hypothetical protein